MFGKAIDIQSLLNIDDFEELVSKFSGNLESTLDAMVPLKMKMVTQCPPKVWFNDGNTKQKQVVRNREHVFKKYKSKSTWMALKAERHKLHNTIYLAKKDHISELVASCGNDSGKLYKLVNNLTGCKSECPVPNKDPESLAEEFANFFLDKVSTICQDLAQYTPYTCEVGFQSGFQQFESVTEDEVSSIIHNMPSKSCECDAIPTTLLKQILPDVIGVITKIVNISLTTGAFSQSWKTAVICPLLKKVGLDLLPRNYRPVSNLCFVSKVVEKCMLKQFIGYGNANDLIPQYQSAYRANHSCETLLLRLLNDALWNMESGKATILTAMDLSVAFDMVDHDILLNIHCDWFGFTGTALNWFNSYLRPHLCVVTKQKARFSERDLTFSVPQGSCAGPVLFLAYASTFLQVVDSQLNIYGFADNHNLGCGFIPGTLGNKDELEKINILTNSLKSINTWMNRNRLQVNNAKTEVL